MKKYEREAFIEDLLAVTSPDYLQSIKDARAEYKTGRTKSRKELHMFKNVLKPMEKKLQFA